MSELDLREELAEGFTIADVLNHWIAACRREGVKQDIVLTKAQHARFSGFMRNAFPHFGEVKPFKPGSMWNGVRVRAEDRSVG